MTKISDLKLILSAHSSILDCIPFVEKIRKEITDPAERESYINYVREIVQQEAKNAIIENNGKGLIAMATGSGKSKVAIDLMRHYCEPFRDNIALLVPTEKLRDENWLEEYNKWDCYAYWNDTHSLCYASGSKFRNRHYTLAIADEGHNITDLNSSFLYENKIDNMVFLTATPPKDEVKKALLEKLGIKTVYTLTLDQAVRLGFVAPYEITVVTVPLNSQDKNVQGGNKSAPFMTTEHSMYKYLSDRVEVAKNNRYGSGSKNYQFAVLKRMQFIYNLKSKSEVVKNILENYILEEDRTLIFCGSIAQAEELCQDSFHSKSKGNVLDKFKKGEINRLSCVKALNEGQNIPNLDSAIICQLNSKDKDFTQRIGRILRQRAGHVAKMWIVVAEGTQDMQWLESATSGVDKENIKYIKSESLMPKYSKI